MRASGRSTKSILTWRSWWRTRTPPSGRSSSPLTSWPTSPSGCLWTGSTRDGNVLTLDKIETHIKFCKVPTKPVTEPRVSEIIQCVMNKSWHDATFLGEVTRIQQLDSSSLHSVRPGCDQGSAAVKMTCFFCCFRCLGRNRTVSLKDHSELGGGDMDFWSSNFLLNKSSQFRAKKQNICILLADIFMGQEFGE